MTLFNALYLLLGIPYPGGHHHINGSEIAGIGLGAAAFVGVVGYLIIRHRSGKQE